MFNEKKTFVASSSNFSIRGGHYNHLFPFTQFKQLKKSTKHFTVSEVYDVEVGRNHLQNAILNFLWFSKLP